MKKVQIVALRQDRKRLLEHLQDNALIHITKCEKPEKGFEKVDRKAQTQVCERNVVLTEQALKILESNAHEKKGLLSSFAGRKEIDPDVIGEIAANAGEVINVCTFISLPSLHTFPLRNKSFIFFIKMYCN